ncbi:CubicO group peptidase (beta-lactamase class C family) [Kitasatospora gansuensis]|uniref:CubicO group peptidase (Beta-lactamase class C family) n=1 Tax=Kitasatospora gansuensis TaxID=258050 RepID=A0A7W7S843_9ACTN|nr:serine hydrolase domain-containing protein [Kitasatospora gansuensis]MBB4945053.1 CubicO group peptidase (beta-lactamase class C family) [Kitasatospora gansuensis]
MLDGLADHCAEALRAHGCPSVSVAVASHGEVVLAEAYGLADVAAGVPATPGTAYGLASATKPVTATAVCLAADDGLLDLDAPVPGSHRWPAPTVRQLLQHRGGFAAHYDFHYGEGAGPIDADHYAVLFREPGSGFEYANLGYQALGRLLEEVTGRSLAEFVRERVTEPLGLTGWHLGPSWPGPTPAAVRYTPDGRAYPGRCATSHPGATEGWATATDLARFGQDYERLLKPETLAAVRAGLPLNPHLGYGLGWCVSSGDGPVVQSHGGGMGGVAAMLATVPEQRLSVAVLTNSTDKAARDSIVRYVLTALVPGYTDERIAPVTEDPARPMDLPPGRWTGTVGTPEGELPLTVEILPDRTVQLRLSDGQQATAPATASRAYDLRAHFPLQLPTADARIGSPQLGLELRLDQGRLTGAARTFKNGDGEGLLGNFLSHPCELRP